MNAIVKISLYELLGVPRDATRQQINDAFKRKAATAHPDKGGNIDDFKQLQAARDCLTNRTSRAWYDETGQVRDDESIRNQAALEMVILGLEDGYRESKRYTHPYDIVGHARNSLLGNIKKIDEGMAVINYAIKAKEKLAKRLARKDHKDSLLVTLILKQADDLGEQIEMAMRDRDIVERGLKALSEHILKPL